MNNLVGSWQGVFQRIPIGHMSCIWSQYPCWISVADPSGGAVEWSYIVSLFMNPDQFLCLWSKVRGCFSYFRTIQYVGLWWFSLPPLSPGTSSVAMSPPIGIKILPGFLKQTEVTMFSPDAFLASCLVWINFTETPLQLFFACFLTS